jgi:hypothetical protein
MTAKRQDGLFKVNGWLEANKAYAHITKEQLHLRYGHPGHLRYGHPRAQRQINGDAEGTAPDQCDVNVMAKHPKAEFKPTLDPVLRMS